MERLDLFRRQFRWKILLLRFVVNTLALLFTAILVPHIGFDDKSLLNLLRAGILLGILMAIVKPIIQFLTSSLFFASYGLVVVVINAVILVMLSLLSRSTFNVSGFLWALLGGAVIGLLSSFLENLLGVNPPFLMLAEQRARQDSTGAVGDGRHGLMGLLVGRTDRTESEPMLQTTEVSDEAIDSRQDTGEPAATAGL